MIMSETLLEIKDLEIIYATEHEIIHAVNGVNFKLDTGRTLGLVGETGAGKTTTALSILGILPERTAKIVGGEIFFKGENVLNYSKTQMNKFRGGKVSMIFQDPMSSLNPVLTVEEQISEALLIHNYENNTRSFIDKRVEELLEMVGIAASRKKDYPHQFSGGMKQRVLIAIALACEPDLIIADEPTTALDVTIQAQVLAMIKELKDRLNTSMLLITHDLGVVAQICDDVAIMYAGEIIEYGTMKDVFSGEFHHPYTKGLFESIPNLEIDTERLKPIPGLMPDPTNLGKGCKFSPRCPFTQGICLEIAPHFAVKGAHKVLCHMFSKENTHIFVKENPYE